MAHRRSNKRFRTYILLFFPGEVVVIHALTCFRSARFFLAALDDSSYNVRVSYDVQAQASGCILLPKQLDISRRWRSLFWP